MKYLKHINEFDQYEADIFIQLEQFMQSPLRNKWLEDDNIKVYVRKSQRNIGQNKLYSFLDLASFEVVEQNKGTFTNFLTELLRRYPNVNLYVESILNPKVESILKKFNFVYHTNDPFNVNMYLLAKVVD